MRRNDIEIELFRTTIQRLTFAYCIPLYDLCDLAYAKEFLDENGVEPQGGVLGSEYTSNARRYSRILKRLCIKRRPGITFSKFFAEPKIYDQFMLESQVQLYNEPAELVGYTPIRKILSVSQIKKKTFYYNPSTAYDSIVEEYPYFLAEKRTGASFIECILLLNMQLTLSQGDLYVLDKKIESYYDKKRVKDMVKELIKNMNSPKMFRWYVYVFFDVFEELVNKKHNEKAEESIRYAWLPKELKYRKDVFAAFERYKKKVFRKLLKDLDEIEVQYNMVMENSINTPETIQTMFDYSVVECMGCELLPRALSILLGGTVDIYIPPDPQMDKLAGEYAEIIKKYIDKAISEAANILNKTYAENL